MTNKDTHADSGSGQNSGTQGRYYPVKGGSSSNMPGKSNDPWNPKADGPAVGRSGSDRGTRRDFVHGSQGRDSVQHGGAGVKGCHWSDNDGADGPDGSGGGTSHDKSGWFAAHKNNGGTPNSVSPATGGGKNSGKLKSA